MGGVAHPRKKGGDAMDESIYRVLTLMITFGALVALIMSDKNDK